MSKETKTIAVIGNLGVGKTLLVESMAFKSGAVTRLGELQKGTSKIAVHQEEKDRKMSLFLCPACFDFGNYRFQMIDTPGSNDFRCDRTAALSVADAALLVIDPTIGVDMASKRLLSEAQSFKLPVMVVVSRMDNSNANADCWKDFGVDSVVPFQTNINTGNDFDEPTELLAEGSDLPESLLEKVVEQDEELMEAYFEGNELPFGKLKQAFANGVLNSEIVPVLFCSSVSQKGTESLANTIGNLFPGPKNSIFSKRSGLLGKNEPALQIFKTRHEGKMGEVQYARVASGTIKKGDTLKNSRTGDNERLTQLYKVNIGDREGIDSIEAGDIVALVKLKSTLGGDTLGKGAKLNDIPFPKPTSWEAIDSETEKDATKVSDAIKTLLREDPAVTYGYKSETHQNVIECFGEIQLSVLSSRAQNEFGVKAIASAPKIPFKETFTSSGNATYRHKKQSGGSGQFGECALRVKPLLRDGGFEFVDSIVGGKIPKKFIGSVEKGVSQGMEKGSLIGAQVVDIEVSVFDGKTHDVDSNDISFQIAGLQCFRLLENQCQKIILEPIYKVNITIPDNLMGEIIGDLNARRGKILGQDATGQGLTTIKAEVPLMEMYKYDNSLRSIAKGDGFFDMEFHTYEPLPADQTKKIVTAHEAEKKA